MLAHADLGKAHEYLGTAYAAYSLPTVHPSVSQDLILKQLHVRVESSLLLSAIAGMLLKKL